MFSSRYRLVFLLLLLGGFPGLSAAQESSLTEEQFLDYLRQLSLWAAPPATQARATTFGVNSGFGLPSGMGYVAGALTDRRERKSDGGRDWDASSAFGIGFGDARESLGLELNLGITSMTPSQFADSGNLNVRVFRELPGLVPDGISSVALGVGNVVRWGDASEEKRNLTVSYSTLASLPFPAHAPAPVMVSLGYGSAIKNLERDPAIFFGAGVGIHRYVSGGISWAGDEWLGGITVYPPADDLSLQVSVGVGDITERVSSRRFLVILSLVFDDLF